MTQSKYNKNQWKLIILEYWISNVTQTELASEYNVSQCAISKHTSSETVDIIIEIKNKMKENNVSFEEARKICKYPDVFTEDIFENMKIYVDNMRYSK